MNSVIPNTGHSNACMSQKSIQDTFKEIEMNGNTNDLEWLSKITGKDNITIIDLIDGFSFLQVELTITNFR